MKTQIRKLRCSIVKCGIMTFMLIMFVTLCVCCKTLAARVVANDVIIRNGPSSKAEVIGALQKGDEVKIRGAFESEDGYVWYYIQLENANTGYVRSDLIEASDEELAVIDFKVQEKQPAEQPESEKTQESANDHDAENTEPKQQKEAKKKIEPGEESNAGITHGNGTAEEKDPNPEDETPSVPNTQESETDEAAKSSRSVPLIVFLTVLLCVSVFINIALLRIKGGGNIEKIRKPSKCPACGSEIVEGVDYCPICGEKIDW